MRRNMLNSLLIEGLVKGEPELLQVGEEEKTRFTITNYCLGQYNDMAIVGDRKLYDRIADGLLVRAVGNIQADTDGRMCVKATHVESKKPNKWDLGEPENPCEDE